MAHGKRLTERGFHIWVNFKKNMAIKHVVFVVVLLFVLAFAVMFTFKKEKRGIYVICRQICFDLLANHGIGQYSIHFGQYRRILVNKSPLTNKYLVSLIVGYI